MTVVLIANAALSAAILLVIVGGSAGPSPLPGLRGTHVRPRPPQRAVWRIVRGLRSRTQKRV